MYEFALEDQQRYKEGKVILEKALVKERDGFEENNSVPPSQQQQQQLQQLWQYSARDWKMSKVKSDMPFHPLLSLNVRL